MAHLNYKNGYYDGEVNYNNEMHGYGTFVWNDGVRYEGEWRNGNFNGHGKITYPDGRYYDGEWRDGKRHGYGKMTYSWGYYEGQWENDSRGGGHGIEAHTNSDGVIYEGNFIDRYNVTDVTCTKNGKKTHGKIVSGFFKKDQNDNIIMYEGRRYVEIDGYYFGEEAMARMQPSGNHGASIHYNGWAGRSIFPKFVIEAITYSISNGLTELQENGRNRHYCGSISVITTTDNRHVITVFDNPNQNK